MSLLLGLQDEPILPHHAVDWTCNKIGGEPNWMNEIARSPVCKGCRAIMMLTTQLYCPLDGSVYHRSLYVFTCINTLCRGKPFSWVVIRCQMRDKEFGQSALQEQSHEQRSNEQQPQQFFVGDWCSDADDWGDDNEPVSQKVANVSFEAVQYCDKGGNSVHIGTGGCAKGDNSDLVVGTEAADFSLQMKQMNIDDIDPVDVPMEDDVSNEPIKTHIISEDKQPSQETFESMLGVLACGSTSSESPSSEVTKIKRRKEDPFVPYFLSVFEEPDSDECVDSKHIRQLLKEYEKKDGSGYRQEFPDERASAGGAEKYEKGDLKHGDKVFYKFTKRVSRCPKQCIRYEWNGNPLFMSQVTPSALSTAVPPCPVCGECRVFELQLMPALANALRDESDPGMLVEFGTVLIFTCRGSCWQDGDTYKEEVAMVMQDPDHYLFK